MFKQTLIAISISAFSTFPFANTCDLLPNHQQLTSALKSSVATTSDEKNGGLELNMWGTLVGRDGTVCAGAMLISGVWKIKEVAV